jgi:TonB-linked SusC/RagA family outer membrane protein
MRSHSSVRAGPLIAVAAAVLLASPLAAQAVGRVQGTVVSEATQRPMAGAQVFVQGTGIGTITTAQGRFLLLNVPVGTQTVRVQMIGYENAEQTVQVAADQTVTVDFQLSETAVALAEIVVTGTAAPQRRREIGNSMESVSAKDLEFVPIENPQQALAGRAAGVTVMTNSGQPGAGGTIKIRGTNTITQNTHPLVYVDGVRVFNEPTRVGYEARTLIDPLQDIAAEDIERIEIVKGAAATTLYGTEAAAGVIQIFTKKGYVGVPVWHAEIGGGLNAASHFGPSSDPTDLFVKCSGTMIGLNTSSGSRGEDVTWVDPTCPERGTWVRSGAVQRYGLSVRGGASNVTYYVSGTYGRNAGILPTQDAKDGGFRGNFTFSPMEGLNFALNTAYTRRDISWVMDGNNAQGFLLNVGRGYRGNFKGGKGNDCANATSFDYCMSNGYLFDAQITTKSNRYTSGFTVNYAPIANLTNRFAIGWDYLDSGNEDLIPYGFLNTENGTLGDETTWHEKLSLDYAGTWSVRFGGDFASALSWGGQLFRDRSRFLRIDVLDFAGPGRPTTETAASLDDIDDRPVAQTNAGLFLQEQVGWKDRLFVTAGLRVDGNSAFGENFGLQPYPKVSLAYVLSDHSFWPAWFETFKLRFAMGESGKAPGPFDKLRTWTPISGDESQPGFTPNEIGNPDIGPERTLETETGFDASLFGGRLGAEITYYHQHTFDALVPVQYAPSMGFLSARNENVGELRNTGVEANVRIAVMRTDNVDWRLRFNGSFMKSKALNMDGQDIYTGLKSYIREGYTVPMYFGSVITNPDAIADPVVVSDTAIGPVYPQRIMGFGTSLTLFGRVMLDAQAEYQGGHYLPNYTGYQNARRGVWYPCYDEQRQMYLQGSTDGITAADRYKCSFQSGEYNSDFWVEPADFLKLRSISLTYQIPQRFLRYVKNADITLAGTNLFTWTKYTGSDPEIQDVTDQFNEVGNNGSFGRRDYYQIPPMRTFMLTIRTTF